MLNFFTPISRSYTSLPPDGAASNYFLLSTWMCKITQFILSGSIGRKTATTFVRVFFFIEVVVRHFEGKNGFSYSTRFYVFWHKDSVKRPGRAFVRDRLSFTTLYGTIHVD